MTKLEKKFKKYAQYVKRWLHALDAVMEAPQSEDRGKKVAHLSNLLEMETDKIRRFDFGIKLNQPRA